MQKSTSLLGLSYSDSDDDESISIPAPARQSSLIVGYGSESEEEGDVQASEGRGHEEVSQIQERFDEPVTTGSSAAGVVPMEDEAGPLDATSVGSVGTSAFTSAIAHSSQSPVSASEVESSEGGTNGTDAVFPYDVLVRVGAGAGSVIDQLTEAFERCREGGTVPARYKRTSTAGMRLVPPEPQGLPDPQVQARIIQYREATRLQNTTFNEALEKMKDFHNPSLLDKIAGIYTLEQTGSMYPRELFSAHPPAEDYYEALAEEQKRWEERKEAERKARGTVEFAPPSAPAVPGPLQRVHSQIAVIQQQLQLQQLQQQVAELQAQAQAQLARDVAAAAAKAKEKAEAAREGRRRKWDQAAPSAGTASSATAQTGSGSLAERIQELMRVKAKLEAEIGQKAQQQR